MAKIPTSLFSRGTKLMGLASRMALDEISSKVKTWETEKEKVQNKIKLAQDMVKTLSQLKGASMKLGQLLSLDMGEYLPPEFLKVLEQLHKEATYLPYEKIKPILERELGEKFSHFTDISKKPIAAASIGQVHLAKLDGRDVVIKVQYPGVAESIPSDLKLLEVIFKQVSFFQGKDVELGPFFNELEDVLKKEADYHYELSMHELYREKFKEHDYIVPEAFKEYSTSKVLTQEFIEGTSISEWFSTNPPEEEKSRIAELLMQLYLLEFYKYGIVQTDPNPGNFLITPQNQVALLDFGAVKEYSKEFREGYKIILQSAYGKKYDLLLKESIQLGFIDERENQEVKGLYVEMIDALVEPFRQEEEFDFSDKTFFNQSRNYSWNLTRKCKYSPPPKDLIFLHRKLAGIFVLIKKLDQKMKLKDYWKFVVES